LRYVNIEKLELPPGWEDEAKKAYDAVKMLPKSRRNKEIERRATVWRKLKKELKKLLHKKCWYCESKEIRADQAVDHYRPKGKIKECGNKHPGYWWLAFDWTNFRYSCTFCNELRIDEATKLTGGKATYFPLTKESKRVYAPGDISGEEPVLLDPTVIADPLLLAFDIDGKAIPRWEKTVSSRLHLRAETSITRYNLNHTDLVERRRNLSKKVVRLINRGDRYFARWAHHDDESARDAFNDVVRDIHDMAQEQAEHSAAVVETLRLYRSRGWVDAVFSRLN
jgi:uncharacterized protein (TIGR02646 family)